MIYFIVETIKLLLATIGCVFGAVAMVWLIWFISTVIGKLWCNKPDSQDVQ